MLLRNISLILRIFCCVPFAISSREYLKEKPTFLNPCKIQNTNLQNCYKDNLQSLLLNWKNGVPGLPAAGKLDPLKIKRMKIKQNELSIELKNISIKGLSESNITNVNLNLTDYTFMASAVAPKLRIDSVYKTSGRILLLPLNGNGSMWIEIENLNLSMTLKSNLTFDENLPFIDVQSVRSKVNTIGNLRLDFENLFNGNKELEASTRLIFAENWRTFMEPLLPTIEQTLDAVVLKRFKKVFYFIPFSYFLDDSPEHNVMEKL